jgi:hypothetical protein
MFDTVFTSIGSTTRQLKIYNRHNKPIKISAIHLGEGQNSRYRMNLDGISARSFYNVEIREKDSLFMFIEVTVDPTSALTPYLLLDSVVFQTNGNIQDVDLVAFGQNANFIVADREIITGSSKIKYALLDTNLNANINWTNQLPYVVYGGYAVIDSSQTLNIDPGTRIYLGNGSGIWVYRYGTLKVLGTKDNPVTFQGTRLESYYQDIPGQWDRIWINEGSMDNIINYAVIRNGFIGVQTESLFDTVPPKNLKITNTIIKNMSGFGIFSRYYNVQSYNNVIARCGQYAMALVQGGGYEFRHCTFANYWNNSQRSTPSVYLNDYAVNEMDQPVHFPLYQADFFNCIIWGNNEEELEVDFEFGTAVHSFKNVLVRTESSLSAPHFVNMIINQDPVFMDYQEDDYQLNSGSPAIDAGDASLLIPDVNTDIREINRQASPDLGAYEKE